MITSDNPVTDNCMALECGECGSFIHVGCDSFLTPEVYREHESDEEKAYHCPMCAYDLLYEANFVEQ